LEKGQLFELTIKKTRSSEFLLGKSEIFPENRTFFGWNRKFPRPDSRPPDVEPDWRRCTWSSVRVGRPI